MKKLLPLLLFVCNLTIAQNLPSKMLEEVQVNEKKKAAQKKQAFIKQAQTTGVLTEVELNRNNPAFIEQSLGTMAGVQVDKRTQLGGQRLVIRGYGNDQKFNNWGVKAYYNGVPITTAEGVTVLDDIDFSQVSTVEVIKGAASTLYGGGVGGVALFSTKPLERKGVSLSQNTAFGSFGLFQSTTRLDVVNDSAAITLSYGHIQSDGYRPRGASLKNFLNFTGTFQFNKYQKLTAFMSHNFSFEGITGQISYADYYAGVDNGNDAYAKKNARNEFLTTRFSLTHEYQLSKEFTNKTSVFYFAQDLKNVSAGADGNSESPSFGLRSSFVWSHSFNATLKNELTFGTEIQQSRSLATSYRFLGTDDPNPLKVQDISKGSYFKTFSNQYAYFLQNRISDERSGLSLLVGLSANQIKYNRTDLLANSGLITGYNKDLSFEKSFSTSFNPHIAIQKVMKGQVFNLSYSEGYNAPTATTAFISGINKANDDLLPEKAKMIDLAMQGELFDKHIGYQASFFVMDIANKLTQLSGVNPAGGTYTYFANTGNQHNTGVELSLNYLLTPKQGIIKKVEPFFTSSFYNFTYTDFKTKFGTAIVDYSSKQVVGVPKTKYTLGLDIVLKNGCYLNNTFNSVSDVYTDFANTNNVKGFQLLNSKVGYKYEGKKFDVDFYVAGNNLTNQVNYTFLFLGNNINDSDAGSNYPAGVATDVNPGASKAYYFGGVNLTYKF